MTVASDRLARRAARHILRENLGLRRGENLIVESWTHTLREAAILTDEARLLGARTLFHYEDENAYWAALDRGQSGLIGSSSEPEWKALRAADVYVFFWGPEDLPRIGRYPNGVAEAAVGFNSRWYEEAAKGGIRGCRLDLGKATDPSARKLGIDGAEWRRRLLQGCLASPQRLERDAGRLARTLRGGGELRIRHTNGTDVSVRIAAVKPRIYSGMMRHANRSSPYGALVTLPSGCVAIALEGNVGEGPVLANRLTHFSDGTERYDVEPGSAWGARWSFHRGRLATPHFSRGAAEFRAAYRTGGTGRDRVSYIILGVNPAIHDVPQSEQLEAGSAVLGIGSNRFLGGPNASRFEASAAVAGAEISVDGHRIVRKGRIV